jgi:hypothetical protein
MSGDSRQQQITSARNKFVAATLSASLDHRRERGRPELDGWCEIIEMSLALCAFF